MILLDLDQKKIINAAEMYFTRQDLSDSVVIGRFSLMDDHQWKCCVSHVKKHHELAYNMDILAAHLRSIEHVAQCYNVKVEDLRVALVPYGMYHTCCVLARAAGVKTLSYEQFTALHDV